MKQIAVMHVQGDAGRHRGRMCAAAHVKLAARDATAFLQALTATRICAHAMPVSRHMATSPSALRIYSVHLFSLLYLLFACGRPPDVAFYFVARNKFHIYAFDLDF